MIQKVKMFLLEAWAMLTCINCGDARNGDAGLWLREYMTGPYRGRIKRFYFPKGTYKFYTKVDMPKDSVIYCFGDIVSYGGILNIQGGTLNVYGTIGYFEPVNVFDPDKQLRISQSGSMVITGNVTCGSNPSYGVYIPAKNISITGNGTFTPAKRQ